MTNTKPGKRDIKVRSISKYAVTSDMWSNGKNANQISFTVVELLRKGDS